MDAETKARMGTPGGVLRAALEKEKAAYAFYDQAAQSTNIALVRDLLLKLKDEEARHMRLIEKQLTTLSLG